MEKNNGGNKRGGIKFNILWMYFFILVVLGAIFFSSDSGSMFGNTFEKEVSATEFEKYVQSRGVKSMVVIDKSEVRAELNDSLAKSLFKGYEGGKGVKAYVIANIPSADRFANSVDEWNSTGVFKGDVRYENSNRSWGQLFLSLIHI